MQKVIKLVLIYFLMQMLAAIVAGPCSLLYTYLTHGDWDADGATEVMLAPAMLLGFIFMGVYLWCGRYLTGDKRMYSPVSLPYLGWSLAIGAASIFLIDFLMSYLTFLPDRMKNTFDLLQSGWLGIACVAVLGPVLEELLFRGAITKLLLQRYAPAKAILISGLLFGVFHLNPVQVVAACLSGFLFAWIYYKSKSLIPGILIHILNNGLSVWLNLNYKEVDTIAGLLGEPAYTIALSASVVLFLVALKVLDGYRLPDADTN